LTVNRRREMRKEERELLVEYFENMRDSYDSYIGGKCIKDTLLSEYDAFDAAIKAIRKLEKIEGIIKIHDYESMPEDYFYIDKIREVLSEE
jgi:deoxyadenosine/deoxycytidine kinase